VPEQIVSCVYFDEPGPQNTARTLELARQRAEQLGIRHIVVASTSGATGALVADLFAGMNVVVVSHATGLSAPNQQTLNSSLVARIEASGAHLLTSIHAFGGVGRAVRRKLGTYQLEEIIAFTLRNFGQGMKVVCECTMMAADAGLIPSGEEVVAIAGTGKGADTAAVLLSANAQEFFDLRVLELLCKPRRPK
jgi:hypothetical protein